MLDSWERVVPLAVRLGERLHESPDFARLRERAAPAAEALDMIASLVPV